ncbi:hypothetical protein B0H15DRAFT_958560 [Mycena belliarum]|uniref:Uncharacterized protein n=1 Tax=Mycena belliarum TaxID=1033014 RepID=A0AAD6TNT1_9AGAR|nr:hypothetical protein B0H15DRAFT_958560 [Mycena belliae]
MVRVSARAAVSLPASAVLEYQGDFAGSLPQATESFSGYHDDNNDSYRYVHNTQSSDYFRDDYVQDDTAAYMPIFSLNSQEWPPSPPPKLTGSKRPSSPTPLLGTSPKRAHISTGYDSLSWSSSPIPTLSTAQNMTSEGDQPLGHTPRPAPLAPAAHLAPLRVLCAPLTNCTTPSVIQQTLLNLIGSSMSEIIHTPSLPLLKGPVNKSRKKADLQEIAQALGLDTSGLVGGLVGRIKAHLENNTATLGVDPRFVALYTYSTAHQGSKRQDKTSADKSVEDNAEASKASALTATDKKLKELNITTDPPSSFAPLSLHTASPKKDKPESVLDASGSSDLTSTSSDGDGDDSKPTEKKQKPKPVRKPVNQKPLEKRIEEAKPNNGGTKGGQKHEQVSHNTVLMRLSSTHGPSEDVFVPSVPIIESKTSDGSVVHQTRLSSLLPALVENNSPMKAKGGVFMRTGIRGDDSFMAAGTVEQHMNKHKIKALQFDPADLFNLTPTAEGYYTGDILVARDAPTRDVPAESGGSEPEVKHGLSERPPGPTNLTGSASDKPLDLAREREKIDIFKNAEMMDKFHTFLLFHAGVDLTTYPAGPVNDMAEALRQHLAYEEVLEAFKPWLKKRMGYAVPHNIDGFPRQNFTKEQITSALHLKSSTAGNLGTHFKHVRLTHTLTALEWVTSKGEKHGNLYNAMRPKEWKTLLDANQEAAERKRHRSATSSSSGDSDDSEGEQERERARKSKKRRGDKKDKKEKKKSKSGYSSDTLDR